MGWSLQVDLVYPVCSVCPVSPVIKQVLNSMVKTKKQGFCKPCILFLNANITSFDGEDRFQEEKSREASLSAVGSIL
jgi:hypothetical protein